ARAWPVGSAAASGALVHDARGEARIALPKLGAGAYRLRYETDDDFGAHYTTETDLLVVGVQAGKSPPLALASVLAAESSVVKVGGTARLLATSGFPDQAITVEIWRAGRRVSRQALTAGKDAALIEIPVREEDRGGFGVQMVVVRDHQVMVSHAEVTVP